MTDGPTLVDVTGRGTLRPWAERKRQSLAVAAAFRAHEPGKRHERITHCGAYLEFETLLRPATGERQKRRIKSSFCKERMCPNCQWRRSLRLYGELVDAVEGHLEDCPNDRLLLLTLTMQNVPAPALSASLSRLTTGFRRLSERAWFKRAVKGWFRSLEVTRNATRGDYHPHLHVLLVVPAAYFDPERDLYLTYDEWRNAWQQAIRAPYRPHCDVRVVDGRQAGKSVRTGLSEVAKYCVKPADWITFEGGAAARWRADPEIVRELAKGLRSKRLVGWGGVLRQGGFEDFDDDDPAMIGWNDLPPGWVSEGGEAYNFRGRRDDVPGDFFRLKR